MTDANGYHTAYEFDRNGQGVAMVVDTDNLAIRTEYAFDGDKNLVSVTSGAGTGAEVTTDFRYDSAGRLIEEISDPTGFAFTRSYEYDSNNNLVKRTDAAGYSTVFTYDANDRLVYTVNALGEVKENVYDTKGQLVQEIQYANAIDLGLIDGAITTDIISSQLIPDATRDRTITYAFDEDGRVKFVVDSYNNVKEFIYDNNGNTIEYIAYATPISSGAVLEIAASLSGPLTVSDIRASLVIDPVHDQHSHNVFDAANRAVYQIDAQNYVTETEYDNVGNVLRTTKYANAISPDGFSQGSVEASLVRDAAQDRSVRMAYDAANRQVYSVDAANYVTKQAFDDVGHVIETTTYANALMTESSVYDSMSLADISSGITAASADQITAYVFDGASRIVETTDAEGGVASYTFDAMGNKLSYTNANGNTWTFEYDVLGRLVAEHTPQVMVTHLVEVNGQFQTTNSLESLTTLTSYDALGNVTSRTEAAGTPDQRTTFYNYDALGRQVETIFPPVGVYDQAIDNPAANGIIATESPNVSHLAYYREGTTLVAGAGISMQIDPREKIRVNVFA